jgi:hypothetical protein
LLLAPEMLDARPHRRGNLPPYVRAAVMPAA